ncbi:hypothetical protein ACIQBJ_09575 [Kitasatospora sp. NPDC088391]|uniref:hypothetical protein n=1 Tax=Kitasatospora sp. NPDC088391 TaxID=3364074 RepID=UPI0038225343
MHVHRSAHARHFTVLPNFLLQYRQLSYTARGLLADLLSRPDGWREDGRQMADSSPQGRRAVAKALKELTEAGFYRVERIQLADGRFVTENHVYDTPWQFLPSTTRPVPGGTTVAEVDAPLRKERDQAPTLPAEPSPPAPAPPDARTRAAIDTLFRAIRPEPRLRLGESEARALAPLVARWLERGATVADLAQALLPGLPVPMHSPTGVLRNRLERKLPPAAAPPAVPRRRPECPTCHDPVPRPGHCLPCTGLVPRPTTPDPAVARSGAARVRAALASALPSPLAPAFPN